MAKAKTKKAAPKAVRTSNATKSASTGSDRGIFLTVLLALSALGLALGVIGLFAVNALPTTAVLPGWYKMYEIASLVISAAVIYGIWNWKKWGVYLLAVGYILGLVVNFMITGSLYSSMGAAGGAAQAGGIVGTLVIIGLWYWAIYRKWSLFRD
jgi:hypothetical protein